MANCVITLKACQSPDELYDYAFNLTDQFSNAWQTNYPFALGAILRPGIYGVEYISSGGVSNGEVEPEWPDDAGETIEDGSVTWTAQAVSAAGLNEQIDTVDWSAPADLTISDPTEIRQVALQEARIWVTGGVVGSKYRVTGLLTTTIGTVYELRVELTIK